MSNKIIDDIDQIAKTGERKNSPKILFISTYPPIECGIATFSQDLIRAHDYSIKNGSSDVYVVADSSDCVHSYSTRVAGIIRKNAARDYKKAADKINKQYDLVHIQHEFGIFGGSWGEDLLMLVNNLKIPLVITFHTMARNPTSKAKRIVRKLIEKSTTVFVLARTALEVLTLSYGLDCTKKIKMIPHGTHQYGEKMPVKDAKKKLGISNRRVLSTFGLINKGKGLEYMIRAMENVVAEYPDALYLILGKTHPKVVAKEGESYRKLLKKEIKARSIEGNVKFIDKYFNVDELMLYLNATDIYVTPYLEYNQMVSGTLAYALSLGKVIVSTPYLYAQELLADDRGLFAGFMDSRALADRVLKVFANPKLGKKMQINALGYTRDFLWQSVGRKVAEHHQKLICS